MKSSVNSLGRRPQFVVSQLCLTEYIELLKIDFTFPWGTVLTQVPFATPWYARLAPNALRHLYGEHHEPTFLGTWRGNHNFTRVISLEQSLLDVRNDGFIDTSEWLRQLIGQIPLAVN